MTINVVLEESEPPRGYARLDREDGDLSARTSRALAFAGWLDLVRVLVDLVDASPASARRLHD
ncbi:MAG TPA: hypothetical protein VM600_07470 [Actinomycetota bacterium]|nr:hypothetical protein [Actinomycetota bacterium]